MLLLLLSAFVSQSAAVQQRSFITPDEAVQRLVAAIRENDTKGMIAILGPGSGELVFSGDEVADKAGREKFLKAYDQLHSLQKKSEGRVVLTIGSDNWPLPIPVVKKGKAWIFDARAGQQEILNRRIGRNELRVIDVLHAYVEAQHEYSCRNYSGAGTGEFARRLISSGGKHDGLYWKVKEGEEASPLGPLFALASEEGYADSNLQPFHGYYFRILTGQGKHAEGGAYSYLDKGKMILGFALIAYPAEYGSSGVMTFIVNQKGVIYQKDLAKNTRQKAAAMKIFDPDGTWKRVEGTVKAK
ncbi:MAG: DUF2950 domain-containing protein [Nitrospirales bacterium]|nr:DUF2950 domain-containing protein [Nitrospirales bacterium]